MKLAMTQMSMSVDSKENEKKPWDLLRKQRKMIGFVHIKITH